MDRRVEPPPSLRTAWQAFQEAVAAAPDNDFLCIPSRSVRDYDPDGATFSYAEMAKRVAMWRDRLIQSGFGHRHRVAVMFGNRPAYFELFLAANSLGIMVVPLGPDHAAAEIAHVLTDCRPDLILTARTLRRPLDLALATLDAPTPVHDLEALPDRFAAPGAPPVAGEPDRDTDALLLYTSGTTALPKGCRVANDYFVHAGQWYISRGHRMAMRDGAERIFNPFPMFHMNAGVLSLMAAILTRGCVISADRFHAESWWKDIADTGATIMHYMGVIPPILVNAPERAAERDHRLRFAFGAGSAPAIHQAFEARFGIPMVEVWGMTETGRTFTDHIEPRATDRRAIGRPLPGLEARLVDADDREVPPGTPGELTVRHSAESPRKGFFAGYLNQPEATEQAWRGGWFHTGDVVRQEAGGLLVFVDRTKNIIRRSGENISAGEVEAVLATHPRVLTVAVLPVADELRDEEVLACVVPSPECRRDHAAAQALVAHCRDRLAYFKVPGWVLFRDQLPTTPTNKVQHRLIFAPGQDPRALPGCHDVREQKTAQRLRPTHATETNTDRRRIA